MFHKHLLKLGLFDDDSCNNVLPYFPLKECYKEIAFSLILGDSEEDIPKPFPFNDELSSKWMFHVTSFTLSLASNQDFKDEKTLFPILIIILKKIYIPFIEMATETTIPPAKYNELTREIMLHISMICENGIRENIRQNFIEIVKLIISSKYEIYEKKTWETLFKIILGLCDFSQTSPDAFSDWPEITPFLFSALFRLLVYSTEKKVECWDLFNKFTSKWHESHEFFISWQSNFMLCFHALAPSWVQLPDSVDPKHPFDNDHYFASVEKSDATAVLIHLLDNARCLFGTENYKIVHHEFGFIADSIRKNKEEISPLFSRRWYIDEIFEIFSLWPLAKGPQGFTDKSDPRQNSIESFVMLLEQGLIRRESTWFQETVTYFKRELNSPDSVLSPVLLPKLPKLICSHPRQTRELISPIMKCCLRQKKKELANPAIHLDSPLIMSLILTISELYIHQSTLFGTIKSVKKLLKLVFPIKQNLAVKDSQTWQLHVLTLITAGCYKRCTFDILGYLNEGVPPPEFYVYLMFIPSLFPSFLKSSDGSNFTLSLVTVKNVIDSLANQKCARSFVMAIHEFMLEKSRFQPLSDEKRALMRMLKEGGYIDIANILELSSFPNAQPTDVETARKVEEENAEYAVYFSIAGGLMTIIDNPKKPLIVIMRHAYGCLTFEVNDLMEIEPGGPLPVTDFEPHKINKIPDETPLDGAFSDSALLEGIEELTNLNAEIKFEPFRSPFPATFHPRIFSFLTGSGIASAANEMRLTEIEGGSPIAESYDSIPSKEIIEVAVVHYTPKFCSGSGSAHATPQFLRFLDSLGEPIRYVSTLFGTVNARAKTMGMVQIVYLCFALMEKPNEKIMDLPTLIVFNETGCEPIESGFRKFESRLIISAKLEDDPGEPEDGVTTLSLLKYSPSIAYPIIHSIPRIVSKRNIQSIIAMFCIIDDIANGEGKVIERRKAVLTPTNDGKSGCAHLITFPLQ